jgi:TMEM175 potassium channel family protein
VSAADESPDDGPDTDGLDESPDRLIALSDGIFAIAMTLLVLNISVPSGLDHAHFRRSLHDSWSAVGAYGLTFAITAGRWRDHRRIFQLVRRTNAAVVRLTLALLGVVALLPFPTALLSQYGGSEPLAIVYYAATMGVINILLLALFLAVRRDERLQARVISDRLARAMVVDFGTSTVIAVVAIVVAFAASPTAGLLIWLAAIPAGLAAQRLRSGA